jgi:CRISPR/Cas system-associated endonuclease Cas1
VGLEIARYLLGAKLDGQAGNLELIRNGANGKEAVEYWRSQINEAATIDDVLEAEREAAAQYWACWAALPVRFAQGDLRRIPEHWLQVGTRHSPLSNSPRTATSPMHATLNYCYAVLEAEARVSCLTLGLDPGVGVWHADYKSRDSLVLDLMEAARPAVDRYALGLIQARIFTRADFGETSRGICRVLPALAHEFAQMSPRWREAIAPHAEEVAPKLAAAPLSRVAERLPTPLTHRNRSAAQAPKRRRPKRPKQPPSAKAMAKRRCKRCGGEVPDRERTYCDACYALPQSERYASTLGLHQGGGPSSATDPERRTNLGEPRTSRRCKRCGDPVSHRKRVLCDPCFVAFRQELDARRRSCNNCGQPVPHRKRALCDDCLADRASSRAISHGSPSFLDADLEPTEAHAPERTAEIGQDRVVNRKRRRRP